MYYWKIYNKEAPWWLHEHGTAKTREEAKESAIMMLVEKGCQLSIYELVSEETFDLDTLVESRRANV